MPSAWKQARSRFWYVSFTAGRLPTGGRRRYQVKCLCEIDNRDDALRVAMHLEDCARTVTGETRELEIIHGAHARAYALQVMRAYGLSELDPEEAKRATRNRLDAQVRAFLHDCKELRPRTQQHYAETLARFQAFAGAAMRIDSAMHPDTLRRFARHRQETVKLHRRRFTDGHRAMNSDRQILRRFGNWLVESGAIAANPVPSTMKKRRETPGKRELLTDSEIAKLLAAARAFDASDNKSFVKWHAALRLLLESGLRIGELVTLQWGDIVFDGPKAPMLRVRAKAGWKPKDGEDRDLPLHVDLAEELKAWRDSIPVARWRAHDAYVMTWGKTRPRRLQDPGKQAQAIFAAAGVPWRGFHITRHTFAVRCIRSKQFDILQVAQLMGHSDVQTTMVYLQWAKDEELVTTGRELIPRAG